MTASGWTFFSNHTHVLVCIARDPEIRVRTIAERVGITERAVLRVIGELEQAGFLEHTRIGRRNRYWIHPDGHLRHELEAGVPIRSILEPLVDGDALEAVSMPARRHERGRGRGG